MEQITLSTLFMGFLGLTEKEVDLYQPFGSALKKIGKQKLDENMESIAYALSPTQLFLLIIDNDNESRVTTQKTYWNDLDKYYEILKKSAVPNMKRSDSNGFYLHSSQLGARICVNGYIFIEKNKHPNDPECIAASVNIHK